MCQFIGVYDGAVPKGICQSIIDRFDELHNSASGSEYSENNSGLSFRKDVARYFHIDAQDLASQIHQYLNKYLELYIDEHPALGMHKFYSNIVKVQKTPPKGGFHLWHSEADADPLTSPRCLSWMIYLNDTADGEGTTEFIEQGQSIQPRAGRMVLFPADWTHTHRGNPVYSSNKYIATGWYTLTN